MRKPVARSFDHGVYTLSLAKAPPLLPRATWDLQVPRYRYRQDKPDPDARADQQAFIRFVPRINHHVPLLAGWGAEYKHEILLRAIAPGPMPDQGEDIKA